MLQTPRVLVKEEVAAYERLVDLLRQKSDSNMSLQSSSSSSSAASEMEEKNIQEREEEEAEEEARHERAEEERKNQEEEVEERYKEKGEEEEEKCREAEADTEEKLEKESKEEVEHGREEQKDGGTEERQHKEEEAEERKEEGNDEDREERKEAGIENQEEVERGEGEEDIEDERKQENHHREGIEREEDEEKKKKKLVSSKDVEKEKGKEKNGHTEELQPEQKNGRAFSSTVIVEEVPAAEGAAATVEDRAITASNDRATAHITGAAFAAAEETETLCTAAGVCTFTAGSCEGDGHENSAAGATSDSAPAAVAARRVVAASSASIATVPERARIYTAPDHVSEGAPEGAAAAEKETEDEEEEERLEQTLEQNKAIPAEDDVLYRGGQTSVETGAVRQAVLSAAAPTGQETRVNLKPVAATTTPGAKSLQTPATEAAAGGATTGIVSPGVAVAAAADAAADGAPSFEEAAEAAATEAAAAEAAVAEAAVAEAAAAEAAVAEAAVAAAEAAVAEAAVAAAEVVAAEAAAVGAAAVGQATTIGGVAAEAAPAGAVSAERVAAAGEAVVAAAAIGKLAQSGEREERRCTPYTMAVAAGASEPAAAVLGTTAPDCVAVIVNKAAVAPSRALSMLNAERTFGMGKFENKEEQERKERERQICMGAVACDEEEICRYLTHESSSSRSSGVVLKNMMVPKSSRPARSPREQHMQHGKELELYTEDEVKEERKQEAEQQQSMQLLEQQSLQERIRGEEKREIQEEGKKQRDPQHIEAEMHASCTEVQDERYQQQRQAVTGAITTDKEEQQVKKTQEQEQQPSTRELQHRILAHPLELQQHHLREQQCFTEKQHEHYQNAKKEEEEYAGDVQKEGCREEHVEQGVRYGLSSPAATAAAVDTVSASQDGAAAESALSQKKETDTLTANTDEMDYQDIDELDGAATKIEEWAALKEKLEAELLQQQHLLQEVQETLEEEAQRARKDAWGRSNIQGILDGVMTGSSSRPPVQAPLDILRAEAQRLKQAMDATSRKAESVRKRRFYLEEQQNRQQQCKQQEQQQQLLSILRLPETDSREEEQEKSSNQQPHQQQEEHEQSAGEPQYRTSHDCIPKAHLAECYQSQNKDELSSTYDPAKQEAVGKHTLFADSGASDSSASIKRGAVPISQPSIDRPCAGLFAGLQFKKRGFAGPIDNNTVASLNISSHTAVVTSSRSSQPDMSSATNLRQAPPAARASHAPTIKHDTAGDGRGDIRGTKAATAEKEIFSVRSCPSNEITLPCAVPVADSTASAESRGGPFDIPASATAPHHVVLENSD